jgi:release factor glutamine methyltransferase
MLGNTVGELLTHAQRAIERLDAQYLLAHATGLSRATLIAHPDRLLDPAVAAMFRAWIAARAHGKPVAQIVGVREFYGREFYVDEHVLIPRPETELLVEQALARLSGQNTSKVPVDRRLCLLDMGTGSGCVAISLALENPALAVAALDVSADALRVARRNAERLGAKIDWFESNWYAALTADQTQALRFDAIVANPPYVANNDVHLMQGDLRFEPRIALTDNSHDGLDAIRTIIDGAPPHLHAGGWLLMEHGYDQAPAVRALLDEAEFSAIESVNDLAGIPRVTLGQRPSDVAA